MRLGYALKQLLGVFLESSCPLCERSTSAAFCLDCERQVRRCQVHRDRLSCHQAEALSVYAWGGYGGALKRAIAALKYHNHPQLAEPLGDWMAEAWQTGESPAKRIASKAIVVPIPMYIHKQRERGFNQAELLAKSFCAGTRLPLASNGLERCRATTAQFGLGMSDRQQNLQDAFTLGKAFRHHPPTQPILLLDDIYTTGSTAQSAAKTLRQHGIRVQGIIVLAKTNSFQQVSGA
jgi:ComF family protein